ncbi:MAG: triose-phosphate isomerase [Planctomycetota bacterium]
MARTTMIAGNWKMNLTPAEGEALVKGLADKVGSGVAAEVLVCPTFTGIPAAVAAAAGSAVQVGAQNCYWQAKGAYTGELSAPLLKAAGCSHILIGHSERRQYFGETEQTVNKRLNAVLAEGLVPVVCIGETLDEREGGQLETVLRRQVEGGLAGIGAKDLQSLIIAYEPVWAIGTGVTASTEQAQEAHSFVRGLLRDTVGELADSIRILYGGSVKPDNAAELLGQPDIDGALVGGASLKLDDFGAIIDAGC